VVQHALRQSDVWQENMQRLTASHVAEVAQARSCWQSLVLHAAHAAPASGTTKLPARAPHVSLHSFSQWVARHALSAETSSIPPSSVALMGLSIAHCIRHFMSPLQPPTHDSYAAQAGSASAHALDLSQQFALAHEAQVSVP
jgi:hypothetical protein